MLGVTEVPAAADVELDVELCVVVGTGWQTRLLPTGRQYEATAAADVVEVVEVVARVLPPATPTAAPTPSITTTVCRFSSGDAVVYTWPQIRQIHPKKGNKLTENA